MTSCPKCGTDGWESIGVHWSKRCGFPEIPQDKKEIFRGLLMGDGWITEAYGTNKLPVMSVAGTSEEFLDHLHNRLEPFMRETRFYAGPEAIAESARKAGMNAHAENTKEQYIVESRSHPYFAELRGWYTDRIKRFPDNLTLTPLVLKYWFACDGGAGKNHIYFAASNERGNPILTESFKEFGVEPVWDGHKLRLRQDDSHKLLSVMGDPVPGYEYKWEIR